MKTKCSLIIAVSGSLLILASAAVAAPGPCVGAGSIRRVRNTAIGNYEYVVFDYVPPPAAQYTVTTVTPPFIEDEGGDTGPVNGNKFKQIRFHALNWTCTINQSFSLPKTAIKGIRKTGQFEAVITYVIGYRTASTYLNTYSYNVGSIKKVVMQFRR
jgi:hypothetical protein